MSYVSHRYRKMQDVGCAEDKRNWFCVERPELKLTLTSAKLYQ